MKLRDFFKLQVELIGTRNIGWFAIGLVGGALLGVLLYTTCAGAQQPPFVPFTIDAQKYQQIDEAMGKLAMPRDAHSAWIQLWQGIERQAQQEEAAKNRKQEIGPNK